MLPSTSLVSSRATALPHVKTQSSIIVCFLFVYIAGGNELSFFELEPPGSRFIFLSTNATVDHDKPAFANFTLTIQTASDDGVTGAVIRVVIRSLWFDWMASTLCRLLFS